MRNLTEMRVVSIENLKGVNQDSIDCGYNRNFRWTNLYKVMKKKFKKGGFWSGDKTSYVLLRPWMVHSHKGGVPCEDHLRCEVFTNYLVPGTLVLDVPYETLDELPTVSEFQK